MSNEEFEYLLNKCGFKYTKVNSYEGGIYINNRKLKFKDANNIEDMIMYDLFDSFYIQITDMINYLDRYSLFPQESNLLTEIQDKINNFYKYLKAFSKQDTKQIHNILESGCSYLEVVSNSGNKKEIKYGEKFRTILDIYNELEKYILMTL